MELKPAKAHNWVHGAISLHPALYSVWKTMIHRCENPKRAKYADYGARGIMVCAEWHDPIEFIKWAFGNGYHTGLQVDRIDNDGNYEPKNCRFVTPKQNSRNRRNTRYLTLFGETKSIAEWCEVIDISPFTIYSWYRAYGRDYAESRLIAAWNRRADVAKGAEHAEIH